MQEEDKWSKAGTIIRDPGSLHLLALTFLHLKFKRPALSTTDVPGFQRAHRGREKGGVDPFPLRA